MIQLGEKLYLLPNDIVWLRWSLIIYWVFPYSLDICSEPIKLTSPKVINFRIPLSSILTTSIIHGAEFERNT